MAIKGHKAPQVIPIGRLLIFAAKDLAAKEKKGIPNWESSTKIIKIHQNSSYVGGRHFKSISHILPQPIILSPVENT